MAAPRTPQDRRTKTAAATTKRGGVLGSDTAIVAHICGRPVTVPPVGQWRQSANDAMAEGRYNEWAVRVLERDDAITWYELDPTNAEVGDFFDDFYEQVTDQASPAERAQIDALRLRRRR